MRVTLHTPNAVLALSATQWLRLKARLAGGARRVSQPTNPDLPGIGLERLRLQLQPRLPAPGFPALLQSWCKTET